MATDDLVTSLYGATVTLLLLLVMMPMSVETEEISSIDASHLFRRRIPGLKPVTVDELGFVSLKKEADKHTETFVESGEFVVNIGGPNASRFFVAVKTPDPSSTASTVSQQQQQQQQQQNPRPQMQQSKTQKPRRQQKAHQRRRHHRRVRQSDAIDETEVEAIVIEDDASSVVRRQREQERRSRQQNQQQQQQQQTSRGIAFDKYFQKQSIDDYFKKSHKEDDDKFVLREKRRPGVAIVPNGIETDVTVIEDTGGGGGEWMDSERSFVQRDVDPSSEFVDPEKDGSLTLNKLASVLNANESIQRLQLFSDNPSSSVRWEEPAMMSNCWLHKLVANRYSFSPSCQPDGTYYNKQCYLERCWCVDNEGRPRDRKFVTRFAYKMYGSLLYCSPQLHAVVSGNLLRPPESEFQIIVHTAKPKSAPANPPASVAAAAAAAAAAAQPGSVAAPKH